MNGTDYSLNMGGEGENSFTPLYLSNKAFSFNFISFKNPRTKNLNFSVAANENKTNGQFASIALEADEVHKLYSLLLKATVKGDLGDGQYTIAQRMNSVSLVFSKDKSALTLYLNKQGLDSSYLRLESFGANLIRIKSSEHLCKLFDLPDDVVCKMISSISI